MSVNFAEENPAHAYFKDRLNELYDESIEGRLAMEIGKLQEYVRAINDIQDGVIGQLLARVRALEEQLQQGWYHADVQRHRPFPVFAAKRGERYY